MLLSPSSYVCVLCVLGQGFSLNDVLGGRDTIVRQCTDIPSQNMCGGIMLECQGSGNATCPYDGFLQCVGVNLFEHLDALVGGWNALPETSMRMGLYIHCLVL